WLGIAGGIAWIAFTPMHADAPPLPLDRKAAVTAADAVLQARSVTLGPEWKRLSGVRRPSEGGQWAQHVFVWREAGPAVYRTLIGTMLGPPTWDVRYAIFEGDVASRAEEWRVSIDAAGDARQVRHVLPEAKPGA